MRETEGRDLTRQRMNEIRLSCIRGREDEQLKMVEDLAASLADTTHQNLTYYLRLLKESFKRPVFADGRTLSRGSSGILYGFIVSGLAPEQWMPSLIEQVRAKRQVGATLDLMDFLTQVPSNPSAG